MPGKPQLPVFGTLALNAAQRKHCDCCVADNATNCLPKCQCQQADDDTCNDFDGRHFSCLTFDMSGSLKRAKRALGCPLDGRVGPQPGGGECCAHLPMVARQACTAKCRADAARLTRTGQEHPSRQRARFKRRPYFRCSEPGGPSAGRRRTDSPACLEREMDSATVAPDLFRATTMYARPAHSILRRQADGERAANGRTARLRMPRDTAARMRDGSAALTLVFRHRGRRRKRPRPPRFGYAPPRSHKAVVGCLRAQWSRAWQIHSIVPAGT